jgi:hypothetical protein
MTGSWEPFSNLGRQLFGSDGGQHSSPARDSTCPETRREHDLEGLHHSAYGSDGRCRLFHRRNVDKARTDHLLRDVLLACGDPTFKPVRYHPASLPTSGGHKWVTRLTRRPGICANIGSCCFCGTLGAIGQRDCLSKLILFGEGSLRRALTHPRALSQRTQSPGEREYSIIS